MAKKKPGKKAGGTKVAKRGGGGSRAGTAGRTAASRGGARSARPAGGAGQGKAKKTAKKAGGQGARGVSKKAGRRGGGPRGGGGGSGRGGGRSANPAPVSSGRGAPPGEIGREVVALFNAMTPDETIWEAWFSPRIVSVEGEGMNTAWTGMEAVRGKSAMWKEGNIVHGAAAEGPYVGATGFAVKFRMDVEDRATGTRRWMEEVGVYTVENGKVVREEFMYGGGGM